MTRSGGPLLEVQPLPSLEAEAPPDFCQPCPGPMSCFVQESLDILDVVASPQLWLNAAQ